MTTPRKIDFSQRSECETKTHELLAGYLVNVDLENTMAYALSSAIRASWYAPRTIDGMIAIAEAMSLIPVKLNREAVQAVQAELTCMVKKKVLRSWMEKGKRLYGVNY